MRGPELPVSYGEDRLDIIVRGAGSIFLLWELDGRRSRRERGAMGDERFFSRRWAIRFAVGCRGRRTDEAIDPRAGKLYASLNGVGRCRAAIGVLGEGSIFHVYAVAVTGELPGPAGGLTGFAAAWSVPASRPVASSRENDRAVGHGEPGRPSRIMRSGGGS